MFGKEDRALGGCGITCSRRAEVKKAGVGTGGGSGPVQQQGTISTGHSLNLDGGAFTYHV